MINSLNFGSKKKQKLIILISIFF